MAICQTDGSSFEILRAEPNEIEYAAVPSACFWERIIQSSSESMNASQAALRRPPPALSVQRVHVSLTLALVVTAILTAGWSVSSGKRMGRVPAPAEVPSIAELKALPGSPANVLSARLRGIDSDEARKLNAAIPFALGAGAAPSFRFIGNVADRNRATDCLALAAMAEAGHGDDGQRAVIQVVLNRVRHAAFAKTICGVVFEGSDRATGCQFSFTCDGSLARRYSAASWSSARNRATQALDGEVYAPVGLATHYHTDWVHPYWSDSLTKLARVDTHLFFRWPGYWGNAGSLGVPYHGGERAITQLAYLPAHSDAAETLAAQVFDSQTMGDTALRDVVVRNDDGGAFVLLNGASSATLAREIGRSICHDRPSCKVFGWFDRTVIPRGYPVPASARAQLGFSYFRDANNAEIVLYDCARFGSVTAGGCIPRSKGVRAALNAKPALSTIAMSSPPSAPRKDGLSTDTQAWNSSQ